MAPTSKATGDGALAERVAEAWGLTAHGFGRPRIDRDRAQVDILWMREDGLGVRLSSYGSEPARRLAAGFVLPDPAMSFSFPQLRAVDDAPDDGAPDATDTDAWVRAQVALVVRWLPDLVADPVAVFRRVRAAAPLGPQCAQLVQRCRDTLALEARHGFAPPQATQWAHHCEITFTREGVCVVVRFEDHELAGVTAEPFTVPEITIERPGEAPRSLTTIAAELEPEHAAQRPVADRYAMALSAVTPWLRHDAAFLRRHPELLR